MSARPWLTRNLKITSAVSLLQDAASELMYPIVPILLTTVLGAPAAVVGAIEGVADGVAALTKYVAGRLADRFPKVPMVGAGYGLAAVGKLVVAAAGVWPVVMLGRAIDRLGKGIRGTPRDALMVLDIDPADRGKAFGFHRMADTTGAVIGPLLALAALQFVDLRHALWFAVIPAVLSVLLVFALKEPPVSAPAAPKRVVAVSDEPLPRSFWSVAGLLGVFSLVNFPDALILLRLHEIGFSVTAVILAYVAYNAVYAGLSYPAGAFADRLGPRRVIAVGLLVFAVAYAGLGLTENHTVAWLLMIVYGAFTALTDGVGKAWVSSLLPAHQQGTGQGVFQGLLGGGVLVAGLWAGLAWGDAGHWPLLVSGGLALLLVPWVLAAGRRTTQAPA